MNVKPKSRLVLQEVNARRASGSHGRAPAPSLTFNCFTKAVASAAESDRGKTR